MSCWHFAFSAVSAFLLLLNTSSAQPPGTLGIRPAASEKGWIIVEHRAVHGYPISIGTLGHTLDAEERLAHRLFDGNADRTGLLYPFQTTIPGFLSAGFFESENRRPFVAVNSRQGGRDLVRIILLKQVNVDALLEHVGAVIVALPASSERVEIGVPRELAVISRRQKAELVSDGQTFNGYLLPVIEEGSIFLALQDGTTQRIRPETVERLTFQRSVIGQVMSSVVGYGIKGSLTGATAGLFAGLTLRGQSALGEMAFGAAAGGVVGMGIGLLDGIFSAEGSETYRFRPAVQPDAMELYLTVAF